MFTKIYVYMVYAFIFCASMKKYPTIIAIDWWKKYIWLASCDKTDKVPMPIGYMENDSMFFYNLSDLIIKKNVSHIIIGMPQRQEDVQKRIEDFAEKLSYLIDGNKTTIAFYDEDYSSIEAWAVDWTYTKDEKQDTLAAMVILKRWIEKN